MAKENQSDRNAPWWLEILKLPLIAAILAGAFTFAVNDREQQESERARIAAAQENERNRILAEEDRKSNLTLQYTEVFISEYKNREDPKVLELLQLIAGIMNAEELTGADAMTALAYADQQIASADAIEYQQQSSYGGDCSSRPQGAICVRFADGYVWLVTDSIIGWDQFQENGDEIEVAKGIKAQYLHKLNTNLVKEVSLGLVETEQCADFESLPLDATYKVDDTFVNGGNTVTLKSFEWSNGDSTDKGTAFVQNGNLAGGLGQEMFVTNIQLSFVLDETVSSLLMQFGEYGGNLNIEINGDFRNFQDFADIHNATIGQTNVTVSRSTVQGGEIGQLSVDGPIESFSIGGQELFIDDLCYS